MSFFGNHRSSPLRSRSWTPQAVSWIRSIGSGLLLGLSMPPGGWGLCALVAWVPLLVEWRRVGTPRWSFARVLGAGGVAAVVAFGWCLRHPLWPSALAGVGVATLWSLGLALPWMAGAVYLQRNAPNRAWVVLIAGTLLLEFVWSIGPWAMPWAPLGHTLADRPMLAWLVAAWGVPGLSLLVLLTNALGAELWRALWASSLPPARATLVRCAGLGLFIGGLVLHAGSLTRESPPSAPSEDPSAAPSLFLVQPGTPASAWAALDAPHRVADLLALTSAAVDTARTPPELIVWPETALPPIDYAAHRARLQRWVDRTGLPVLTGALAPLSATDGPYRHANRLLLFTPQRPPQRYDKHHLVPFVEGVPGADAVPHLASLAVSGGGVAGYRRGPGAQALFTDVLHIAPLICLESVVAPYVRRAVVDAAEPPDLLIAASQTGWWNTPRPARQHLAFSRLRVLETGRPFVLVTVYGPTTLIRPNGSTGPRLNWGDRGVLRVSLPPPDVLPPYARRSPVWLAGGCILLLVLVVFSRPVGRN